MCSAFHISYCKDQWIPLWPEVPAFFQTRGSRREKEGAWLTAAVLTSRVELVETHLLVRCIVSLSWPSKGGSGWNSVMSVAFTRVGCSAAIILKLLFFLRVLHGILMRILSFLVEGWGVLHPWGPHHSSVPRSLISAPSQELEVSFLLGYREQPSREPPSPVLPP